MANLEKFMKARAPITVSLDENGLWEAEQGGMKWSAYRLGIFVLGPDACEVFENVEIGLVEPDEHRPGGMPDEEWEELKEKITDVINGR